MVRSRIRRSFNPRPAFLPGDTPGSHRDRGSAECFNPRPAFLPGDTPQPQRRTQTCRLFQSTPGISAGRYAPRAHNWSTQSCFNPRPAFLPGDTTFGTDMTKVEIVSIHARHFCRAIRFDSGTRRSFFDVSIHARHFCRAIPDDRDDCAIPVRVSIHARHFCRAIPHSFLHISPYSRVSIHARHFCRAIRQVQAKLTPSEVFQSTPGISAGRYLGIVNNADNPFVFQSTPGISAGRYSRREFRQAPHKCFNPRPAFLPGDTLLPEPRLSTR